ncbi:hypothetical protein CQ054_20810 [Ochrobactrum sp. MYb29]|nr:hypothetical protein CQ054_20810 [Ochrobactrum sp. MYb29]
MPSILFAIFHLWSTEIVIWQLPEIPLEEHYRAIDIAPNKEGFKMKINNEQARLERSIHLF